tara:strand:- start:16738 stop:17883 length:1146 start_codon:yes stop_codon:yes gene_type:complete
MLVLFCSFVYSLDLDIGYNKGLPKVVVGEKGRDDFAYVEADNIFTGNNTFMNVTIVNQSILNVNDSIWINGTDILDIINSSASNNSLWESVGGITQLKTAENVNLSNYNFTTTGTGTFGDLNVTDNLIVSYIESLNNLSINVSADVNMTIENVNDGSGNYYPSIKFNDPEDTQVSILDGGYFAFKNDVTDMWLGTTGDAYLYFNYYNGDGVYFGYPSINTGTYFFYDNLSVSDNAGNEVFSANGITDIVSVTGSLKVNNTLVCLENGNGCNITSIDLDAMPNLTLAEISANIGNWSAEDNDSIIRNNTDNDYTLKADIVNVTDDLYVGADTVGGYRIMGYVNSSLWNVIVESNISGDLTGVVTINDSEGLKRIEGNITPYI